MSAMPVASRPIDIQRRLVELGRIRLGDKGPKGEPRRLTTFRLTSASRTHLEAAAAVYGGEVRRWQGAPDDGYWELLTTSPQLDILIPPTIAAYSQWYELWDAGGCVRRCDGTRESISGHQCMCDPDNRTCAITTRVSVMLPKVPGLGVWRMETHGWNAATTMPATLELLGVMGGRASWVPAVLRLEQRSQKKRVDGRPQTRRFVVPVVDLVEVTMGDLLANVPADIEAVPAPRMAEGTVNRRERVERPSLPPGPPPPVAPRALATSEPVAVPAAVEEPGSVPAPAPAAPQERDVPPVQGEVAEAATISAATAASPTKCDGFDPALGRCVREMGHAGLHQTKDKESWR